MKKIEYRIEIPECILGKFTDALFLDIETTGFHRKRAQIYLIGAGYIKGEEFVCWQWFSDDGTEEELLQDFFSFVLPFKKLVHYNGLSFDLPFLEEKAKLYQIKGSLIEKEQLDLYREIRPLRHFLNLKDLKLPTVESFFRIEREETENGKTLIPVYKSYLESPTQEKEEELRKHNYFDIVHLTKLTEIKNIKNCFDEGFEILEFYITNQYLNVKIRCSYPFPKLVQGERFGILYSFYDKQGEINVPLYTGSLRYYYKNYKDYYFLPYENMVIHKSVAAFVESKHKEKCSAENCFIVKEGSFLRQYEPIFENELKQGYKEKETYFSVEELEKLECQYEYVKNVLRKIVMPQK